MSATGKVRLDMKPIRRLLKEKGLAVTGDVQRFHTNNVNRRIGKYMPHLTGTLETKSKHIKSATEIEVMGPYARYQYFGKAMEGPPPMRATNRDVKYTTTYNPLAGPFWDRALTAAEGAAMVGDLQRYIRMKG